MSETKRPYGSRFRDALVIINPGASNPSGGAFSIVDACREMQDHEKVDTKSICQDPAIRPMVYQLAHLFGVSGHQYDLVHYMTDEAACKDRPRRTRAEALRSQLTNLTPADRSWQGLGRWKYPTGEPPQCPSL